MNTNPYNDPEPYGKHLTGRLGYFHECMTGFEHQVASHMMAEEMIDESLIITKAVHDRYHAAKRNPYNEIEYSDHYARAMASYGTFISACGFEYHGPKGYIRFAPKISADHFKAPFTSAKGWGVYMQQNDRKRFTATYKVSFGELTLKTIGFHIQIQQKVNKAVVILNGNKLVCKIIKNGHDILLQLKAKVTIKETEVLMIEIG